MSKNKRLYRSRTDSQIAGVCGGLAEYFNVDPTLVRLLFVVLFFTGGPGLLIYIALWLIVPEEPRQRRFEDYDYVKPKRDEVIS